MSPRMSECAEDAGTNHLVVGDGWVVEVVDPPGRSARTAMSREGLWLELQPHGVHVLHLVRGPARRPAIRLNA